VFDYSELFNVRVTSCAARLIFVYIEALSDKNYSLPPDFFMSPVAQELFTLFSEVFCFSNDIIGISKDIHECKEGYLPGNTILYSSLFSNTIIVEQLSKIIKWHNLNIKRFEDLVHILPSFGPEHDPNIQDFLQRLRTTVYGLSVWQLQSPRYQKFKIICDGKIVPIRLKVY